MSLDWRSNLRGDFLGGLQGARGAAGVVGVLGVLDEIGERGRSLAPLEDLEQAVDERTRMVVIDRTAAFSGFTYDVKEVSRIAHAKGALVLDDAMQAVGAIDIDVKDDDVDMLVTGAYKWQCGPEGAGFFYIKRELMESIDPRFRNYIWADFKGGIPFADADHEEDGRRIDTRAVG